MSAARRSPFAALDHLALNPLSTWPPPLRNSPQFAGEQPAGKNNAKEAQDDFRETKPPRSLGLTRLLYISCARLDTRRFRLLIGRRRQQANLNGARLCRNWRHMSRQVDNSQSIIRLLVRQKANELSRFKVQLSDAANCSSRATLFSIA